MMLGSCQSFCSTKAAAAAPMQTAAVMYAHAATHMGGYFRTSCLAVMKYMAMANVLASRHALPISIL